MPFVVTVDGRKSRARPRDVEAWATWLNASFPVVREFAVTAGDELQALLDDGAALVDLVAALVEDGTWWIGVGVGDVETPLPKTVNAARGEAFYRARDAVEAAKRTPEGLVVRGDDHLEAAMTALAFVIGQRSPAQAETVALARDGVRQADIAAQLDVTQQAVSKRLSTAGFAVETRLRELAIWLATR